MPMGCDALWEVNRFKKWYALSCRLGQMKGSVAFVVSCYITVVKQIK